MHRQHFTYTDFIFHLLCLTCKALCLTHHYFGFCSSDIRVCVNNKRCPRGSRRSLFHIWRWRPRVSLKVTTWTPSHPHGTVAIIIWTPALEHVTIKCSSHRHIPQPRVCEYIDIYFIYTFRLYCRWTQCSASDALLPFIFCCFRSLVISCHLVL